MAFLVTRASSDGFMDSGRPPVIPVIITIVAATVAMGLGVVVYTRASTPGYAVQIPETVFVPPTDAVFISPTGSDAADGHLGAPVKTLARAVGLAPEGGTIVFRGGVYYDGLAAPVARNITLQPYPHESAWLDGASGPDGAKPWRARALVFGGGYGATVRGLGFRHYAACEAPTSDGLPCAVLTATSPNLVVVNNVFAETSGSALAASQPAGLVLRDNRFWRSRFSEIAGTGDPAPEVKGNLALPD